MVKHLMLIIFLNVACAASKPDSYDLNSQDSDDWEIIDEKGLAEDNIYLKIKNISGYELDVLNPLERKISKKIGDEWVRVKYPYCPCGRNCPNPPNMFRIELNGEFDLGWDKTSIECDGTKLQNNLSTSGLYKITIRYRIPNNGIKEFTYLFSI